MGIVGGSLLACIASVALFLYSILGNQTLKRNGSPLRKPPDTLPLVGNGIRFLQERQKLFAWFSKCQRQFGNETLQITVPSLPPGVIINDPRNLEYVFKREGIFAKGDFFKGRSRDLFGDGIINVDGELWKVQRKAGLNFLNTENLRILTQVALPKYIAETIDNLTARADGTVVDMQVVFHEITTQLMGKMAYNMEMHADDPIGVAFDFASGATAKRFQNPLWPLTEMILGSRMRRSIALVKSFGVSIVASAQRDRIGLRREAPANGHEGDMEPMHKSRPIEGSLIQSLLDAIDDETVVADAALNYLSAGRDTTAQALTWTFYLLTKHPEVVQDIRQEIEGHLRAADQYSPSSGLSLTSLLDVASLPFIHAVFNESIRLFPPIPFEIKQVVEATTLPDGTYLPQSSVVVWCPWAMNRSTLTWGPDAEEFRPRRWLVDGKVKNRSPSEFPVFNGGPRTCLGKRMAELIAVQVIGSMVWAFDFEGAVPGDRVSKSSLTLPMKGGLPCRISCRQMQPSIT